MLQHHDVQGRIAREYPLHPACAFIDYAGASSIPTAVAATVPQGVVAVQAQVTDAIARALPQLCDALKGHIDDRFENLVNRFGAERAILSRRPSDTGGNSADSRPLPLAKYLDEREEEARSPRSACSF